MGRVDRVKDFVLSTNNSELPYHNNTHQEYVSLAAAEIAHFFNLSKHLQEVFASAGWMHDRGHRGKPDSYFYEDNKTNIMIAQEGWMLFNDIYNGLFTDSEVLLGEKLIGYTSFPYIITDDVYAHYMRESDLLGGLNFGEPVLNISSQMAAEWGRKEDEERYMGQIDFYNNLAKHTGYPKTERGCNVYEKNIKNIIDTFEGKMYRFN